MRALSNIWKNVDLTLVILFLLMVLLGWMNLYAATFDEIHSSLFDLSQSHGKQLLWIATSFVLAWLVMMIDGRSFNTTAFLIYGIVVAALIGVLVFGVEIKGSKAWFAVGDTFRLQPAEFAKLGTALAMAKLLSSFNIKVRDLKTRLRAFVIVAVPVALIALQPDTGSALVYIAFIFVLYREGLSGRTLLLGLAAVVFFIISLMLKQTQIEFFGVETGGLAVLIVVLAVIAGLIYLLLRKYKKAWLIIGISFLLVSGYILSVNYAFDYLLSAHQQDRINVVLGIESDPKGSGYNVYQSQVAIGSGGFSGKGFLKGTQTKFDFVPEQSTDFIFCAVGGFIGSFVVVSLFIILLSRLVVVAERQRSNFSRIYGYCVASILFFHFAINIGMTIGLAPVIGIPLPFFSYGGSSLWGFTLLLFVFIRMDAERKMILKK